MQNFENIAKKVDTQHETTIPAEASSSPAFLSFPPPSQLFLLLRWWCPLPHVRRRQPLPLLSHRTVPSRAELRSCCCSLFLPLHRTLRRWEGRGQRPKKILLLLLLFLRHGREERRGRQRRRRRRILAALVQSSPAQKRVKCVQRANNGGLTEDAEVAEANREAAEAAVDGRVATGATRVGAWAV